MMPNTRNTPKMKRPRPHLAKRAPSVMACLPGSLNLLDVAGLPALVDRRLGRAIEPQNREIALGRHGREPVAFLAFRRLWTEVDVGRSVGARRRLVARAERRERLAVGQARGVLGFVERHRPEIGGRNVG